MHVSVSLTQGEQYALEQLSILTKVSRHGLIKDAIKSFLHTKQVPSNKEFKEGGITTTLYLHPYILRDLKEFCNKYKVTQTGVIKYCIEHNFAGYPGCVHWEGLVLNEDIKKLRVRLTITTRVRITQATVRESLWNFFQLPEEQKKFLGRNNV